MAHTTSGNGAELAANAYVTGATGWNEAEATRLRDMGDVLDDVTRADLLPVFADAQAARPGEQVTMVDLGAGTATGVEQCADEAGVLYHAYDGSPALLDARATPDERKFEGSLEDMSIFPDQRFDVSYARAAVAWSSNPDRTIAEQLRVTDHTAVITDFDWSAANVRPADPAQTDITAAGLGARQAMELALTAAKFDTLFGATLEDRVGRVARDAGYVVLAAHVRHELPVADHRGMFIGAARSLIAQLQGAAANTGGNTTAAAGAAKARVLEEALVKYLRIIEAAPPGSLRIRLPALDTVTVRILDRPAKQ